jgi:Protein of unknown function (DUF2752)
MGHSAPAGSRFTAYVGIGSGALLIGALAYIGIADPHRPGFVAPLCPLHALTGLNCPACGGLRMTHDLLHGDLGAAVTDNVFLLFGLPLLAAWMLGRHRRRKSVISIPAIAVVVVATVTWTVVRNLPGFPLVPTLLGG